ncbi:fibronectin type III domain-containing protein 10 [Chanos chanos]|uniref:Fibronectin type III domain-containing protein 10 n=1 Tax=Chanos chanos TaxID=29144 RepID=A0A6J2VQ48_CHACN|nr:fibronectin type III domain-containing protein 10 [Chanos chanos]
MTNHRRSALIPCVALLLYLSHENAGISSRTRSGRDAQFPSTSYPSPSDSGGGEDTGVARVWPKLYNYNNNTNSKDTFLNNSKNTKIKPKIQDNFNSENGNNSTNKSHTDITVKFKGLSHALSSAVQEMADGGPMCAYRVLETGEGGQLCFRQTQHNFRCHSSNCRKVKSASGSVVANVFANGSVLIQWTHKEVSRSLPNPTEGVWQGRQAGFRLTCWWNGSYTQFECAGVHLGTSCRDYLLNELHENVPYRICLHPLFQPQARLGAGLLDETSACVEFSISPTGMQDIVIAMTTVGGAICVMLVIICLLVAYITENIMSPATQHSLTTQRSHHTRSHH